MTMRILMLAPPNTVSGPMPGLAALLAEALGDLCCDVAIEPWGRHSDQESLLEKALGRTRDVAAIRRRVSLERPDVVLIQTSHEWRSVGRDLLLLGGIRGRAPRVVLQFHGEQTDKLLGPGNSTFKQATALLLRMSDGVFVLSSAARDALREFAGDVRAYVVTNPFRDVPVSSDTHRDQGVAGEVLVLLFAGRLIVDKGIQETLDAFARLTQRLPCKLVVAGDGPLKHEIGTYVRQHGLSDRVTLAGYLSRDEMRQAYLHADLLVLPSYHREGFPTVVSEAMNAGLPVVTTRAGGIGDHLREGVHALFVPPRDSRELASALEQLLSDPAMRERMSRANREKVKEFAPDVVAREYLRALKEIAA